MDCAYCTLPSRAARARDVGRAGERGARAAQADQWRIRSELRARFPGKPWLDVLSKSDLLQPAFAAAAAPGAAWAEGEPPAPLGGAAGAPGAGAAPPGSAEQRAGAEAASGAAAGLAGGAAGATEGPVACSGDEGGQAPGSQRSSQGSLPAYADALGLPTAAASTSRPAVPCAAPPASAAGEAAGGGAAGRARGFSWGAGGDARGAAEVARALPGAVRVSAVTGAGLDELQAAVMGMMAQAASSHDAGVLEGDAPAGGPAHDVELGTAALAGAAL